MAPTQGNGKGSATLATSLARSISRCLKLERRILCGQTFTWALKGQSAVFMPSVATACSCPSTGDSSTSLFIIGRSRSRASSRWMALISGLLCQAYRPKLFQEFKSAPSGGANATRLEIEGMRGRAANACHQSPQTIRPGIKPGRHCPLHTVFRFASASAHTATYTPHPDPRAASARPTASP